MNLRTRLLIHAAAVIVALALGLAARAWIPLPDNHPNARAAVIGSREDTGAGSPEVPPVLASDSESLAGLPVERGAGLREELKFTYRSRSPLREELRLKALLAASARSPEDLARAFELLNSATDGYFCQQAVALLVAQWADRDPVAVLSALKVLKDRQLRQSSIADVVSRWAKMNPEAALAYVRGQADLGLRSAALHSVFSELAKRDPVGALKRAREFQEPNFSHGLERSVFGEWLKTDAEAAIRFAFDESNPERRRQFVEAAVEILSYTEPGKAWALYQSLPIEERKDRHFPMQLLSNWVRKDPEAAMQAVADTADPAHRRTLIREAGRFLTFSDEAKAMASADKFNREDREIFLAGVAESFISDGDRPKFGRAAEIALGLGDPAAQVELMRSIGSRWGRVDAPGASEWLATLPAGPVRDAAVGEFVRGVFATDPAAALTWAASITDDGKRERRFNEFFPKWTDKDRSAAEAWLDQTQHLNEADRASLRQKLSGR